MTVTTPIDPGNTGALAKIAENGMAYGMDRGMGGAAIASYVANAVARAICPPGYHVIADDDLRRVTEIYGRTGRSGSVISDYEVIDRLRALIGGAE